VIALFHAIHPAHVESVAWISERKDVLYGFFFLISLIFYMQYLRKGKWIAPDGASPDRTGAGNANGYLALSFLMFLFSLFSKSAAVVLPVTLILFDLLLKRKISIRMFAEKVPFFLLSLLFGLLALKSQKIAIGDLPQYSFLQTILIVNHSVIRYLYMSVFPVGLSAFHTWPDLTGGALPTVYYVSPFISLLLAAAVAYSLKWSRIPAFGMLFFLVCLALVLQVIPVGGAVIAERYSYIPYLGVFFILASAADRLWRRSSNSSAIRYGSVFVLLIACTVFSFASSKRIEVWGNDKNLWDDMIEHYPDNCDVAYMQRAKFRQDKGEIEGAYSDLTKLIAMKKGNFPEALAIRGQIMADSGNVAGAMKDFDLSIKADSAFYVAYNKRGALKMKLNDLQGALSDIDRSISIQGDYYLSWFNRGAVKIALKDYKGAVEDFERSYTLKPDYCEAYYGKAAALGNDGNSKAAIESYTQSIDCNPNNLEAYLNRGDMKIRLNDMDGALSDFGKVLQMNPNYSPAYTKTGFAKFQKGDKAGACEAWKKGAELGDPDCSQNIMNLCK
jgi:protein O-mannosyl-transferase